MTDDHWSHVVGWKPIQYNISGVIPVENGGGMNMSNDRPMSFLDALGYSGAARRQLIKHDVFGGRTMDPLGRLACRQIFHRKQVRRMQQMPQLTYRSLLAKNGRMFQQVPGGEQLFTGAVVSIRGWRYRNNGWNNAGQHTAPKCRKDVTEVIKLENSGISWFKSAIPQPGRDAPG